MIFQLGSATAALLAGFCEHGYGDFLLGDGSPSAGIAGAASTTKFPFVIFTNSHGRDPNALLLWSNGNTS